MKRFVDLPLDRLEEMRSELLSELKQSDNNAATEAYARLVANISIPGAAEFGRVVRGSGRLQVCLNAIILWRRASWLLYPGIVFIGILANRWLLVLIPLVWATNAVALNHLQTVLNVELAARLFLLHALTDEDPAFRDRVFGAFGGRARPERPESVQVTEDAARAMCGAALRVYQQIESMMHGKKVENREFAEFTSELLCYFVHMLDRELSKITLPTVRAKVCTDLVVSLSKEQYRILYELGFGVTEEQALGIFQDQYNHRQIEYGSLGQDWFQEVAVRFGEHAAEALEASETIRYELALQCSLLAPTIYRDLSSVLQLFLESAWKRSHEHL